MKPQFKEAKATQAAGYLLKLRGGKMSYMKLIKLLYILDREALTRWARPVTFDRYVAMKYGPVLSHTLDLITEGVKPGSESYWGAFICECEDKSVKLITETPVDELSVTELRLLDEIFTKYGHLSRWDLVDVVHEFPEWQTPKDGSVRIQYRDILEAVGKTDVEASLIEDELEGLALADSLLK